MVVTVKKPKVRTKNGTSFPAFPELGHSMPVYYNIMQNEGRTVFIRILVELAKNLRNVRFGTKEVTIIYNLDRYVWELQSGFCRTFLPFYHLISA